MPNRTVFRRDFLGGLAGIGAVAAAPFPQAARTNRDRIDVHYHHITPAWIKEAVVQRTMAPQVIAKARAWTPESAIEEMDRNGVETVVCSVSNPGIWFEDVGQARRLSRVCNEYAAELASRHPGRFGSFASLPLPDSQGSLAELAYALDVLKADGIGLFTSYGDKWIADPAFSLVFQELNRRHAVVYVHPMAPSCCRHLMTGIPAALLEYPIDTSRAILQWVLAGSNEAYPNLKLIFSHAGGLIMAGVGRLQILAETQPDMHLPRDFPTEIAKLYYEVSSSADATTMSALEAYAPMSHILLGTDSPFIGSMKPNIDQLHQLALPAADVAAIERYNALALMPRLA